MSLQTVPLQPVPAQSLQLVLGTRNVGIELRASHLGLFISVTCDGVPVCVGQQCRDRVLLTTRARYLGFPDLRLYFADLRGTADPEWALLGTRFLLLSETVDSARRS